MKALVHSIWLVMLINSTGLYGAGVELMATQVNLPGDIEADKVTSLVVDSQGILWLGTPSGLYKMDGQRASRFSNMGSNHVTTLVKTANDAIWAGYDDGSLACFGTENYFISGQWPDSLTQSVSDIVFDHAGRLWWSTYGDGIYCRVADSTINLGIENGLHDEYIYDLAVADDGKIWAASDRGISICEMDMHGHPVTTENYTSQLPDLIVRVLQKDKFGNIWLGFHRGGVGYFDPRLLAFHKIEPQNRLGFGQINAMVMSDDNLWIADEANGLFLKTLSDDEGLIPVLFDDGSGQPVVKAIATNASGYLWILTKNGLFVTIGGGIAVTETEQSGTVNHAILSIGLDTFWTATSSAIILHHRDETKKYLENTLKPTTQFTALAKDSGGNIWAATLGEGIFVFNPENGVYYIINEKKGLINNNVLALAANGYEMWAGTLGGASQIVLKNNKLHQINSFDKEHGLGNNFIYTVYVDKKGRQWFGTDGNGLIRFENGQFYTYDETSGLADDVVYSITEDDDGNIWFSTSDAAVYSFDGDRFIRYDEGQGLEGEAVFSLAASGNTIFALADKGLNIFDPRRDHFICLNEELGFEQLQSGLNSVSSGKECICFATHGKFVTINKALFSGQFLEPTTSINYITVNLEPVPPVSGQSFAFTENRFVFSYSGSWPMAPSKLQYRVKLDGYDPEWKNTYDVSAAYPNLSPGDYTFRVKAFLGQAEQAGYESRFGFTIRKPFYSTAVFIVIMTLLGVAIIFGFIRIRERQFRMVEARKKEQLEFEFQTLKNQVNPHFLFNSFSTLISIIEDDPDEAVEYTEALSGFFRDILEVKEDLLIPISEEIRILGNYSLIHQKRLGGNFNVVIQLDEKVKSTKIPPLTLQLLAENALKHNIIAKDKPLTVTLRNDENTIVVENNKRLKKQPERSTGIGLKNISDRYRLISGTDIVVEESEEMFRVKLPIIQ